VTTNNFEGLLGCNLENSEAAAMPNALSVGDEISWMTPQWSLTRAAYFNLASAVLCWTVVAVAVT
jgi:hypothetical protein